jgi:hypothetical protein
MQSVTIGLDLAKHVFQAHGIDERGDGCFDGDFAECRSTRSSPSSILA